MYVDHLQVRSKGTYVKKRSCAEGCFEQMENFELKHLNVGDQASNPPMTVFASDIFKKNLGTETACLMLFHQDYDCYDYYWTMITLRIKGGASGLQRLIAKPEVAYQPHRFENIPNQL